MTSMARQYQGALQDNNYAAGYELHKKAEHYGIYSDTHDIFPDGSEYIVRETLNMDTGHGFKVTIKEKE